MALAFSKMVCTLLPLSSRPTASEIEPLPVASCEAEHAESTTKLGLAPIGPFIDRPTRPLSAKRCNAVVVDDKTEFGARRAYSSNKPTCCAPIPSPIIKMTFLTLPSANVFSSTED